MDAPPNHGEMMADWKRYPDDSNRVGRRFLDVDCEISVQRFCDGDEEWTVRVFPYSVAIDARLRVSVSARDEADAKAKAETLAALDY